ncbi:hypothetical protein MVEN_00779000 [Mycena venus]|uniref:Uncharacterized protein n=1 Tax=Mycena venus TaxID=2733690 RepID=A0A8H6YFZ6_9AGAR|nr:hypothetical protein MVEN_00779000 [Mycena venus]
MPTTTLESQRRNSVVLLEALPCNLPHLPPPPSLQESPPLHDSEGLKVTVARPTGMSQWQSPQTTRRLRHDAAERAFLNIRKAVFTPPLLTRNSRFPSRTLPPPGLRGCNLDATDTKTFAVGDSVRVRRLNIDGAKPSWSEWQRGQVVSYVPMRVFIGNFGHAYCVRVPQSGEETVHVQFMGEICLDDGLDHEKDSLTAEECMRRRQKANYIYTRIPSDKTIAGVPHKDVWTPAEVLKWIKQGEIFVRSLAGPTAGQKLVVAEALPYTLETAVACRKQAQNVIGPTGKLFLSDIAIKPLKKAIEPSTVSLPSLSALAGPQHPSSQQ